jgi:hypothetical protein
VAQSLRARSHPTGQEHSLGAGGAGPERARRRKTVVPSRDATVRWCHAFVESISGAAHEGAIGGPTENETLREYRKRALANGIRKLPQTRSLRDSESEAGHLPILAADPQENRFVQGSVMCCVQAWPEYRGRTAQPIRTIPEFAPNSTTAKWLSRRDARAPVGDA